MTYRSDHDAALARIAQLEDALAHETARAARLAHELERAGVAMVGARAERDLAQARVERELGDVHPFYLDEEERQRRRNARQARHHLFHAFVSGIAAAVVLALIAMHYL